MHASLYLTLASLLPLTLGAPRPPFRLPHPIKSRQNDSAPPTCDLSSTPQPPNALTPPPASLSLVLIALGQGTQNYTCGTNLSLAPTPIGALATLYNASCSSSTSETTATDIDTSAAAAIGSHFFVDNTTPDFLITGLGNTQARKVEEVPAPQPSVDVKWLRLEAKEGSSSNVKMIYRLRTKGGVAPGSCEGRGVGDVVAVGYQAEYWVYA